jgi:carbamoyl-phosphate synthase large subunit
MKSVLITGANSDVSLSMARIIASHEAYRQTRIIGLSPDGAWPARAAFHDVRSIPVASHPGFPQELQRLVSDIRPDLVIPFPEAELAYFLANPEVVKNLGAPVFINPPEVLAACLDKLRTAAVLKQGGIQTPRTVELTEASQADLPLLIKPRSSAGSKNIAIARNVQQLHGFIDEHRVEIGKFIAQELIDEPDQEYTCALWRMGGELRTCTLWRRLQGGMTGVAKVRIIPAIDRMLERLALLLPGDLVLNVQLRMRNGIPYVFEINPRFSSTVMMRHKIGFHDVLWTLEYRLNGKLPPVWQAPAGTTIYRVSDEVVSPLLDEHTTSG